jgi:hypothetical protein
VVGRETGDVDHHAHLSAALSTQVDALDGLEPGVMPWRMFSSRA